MLRASQPRAMCLSAADSFTQPVFGWHRVEEAMRGRLHATVVVLMTCGGVLVGAASSGAQTSRTLPLVWVLATGGTIAGRGGATGAVSDYKSGVLTADELVKSVPEVKQFAEIKVEQVSNVASGDLTLDDLLNLS